MTGGANVLRNFAHLLFKGKVTNAQSMLGLDFEHRSYNHCIMKLTTPQGSLKGVLNF